MTRGAAPPPPPGLYTEAAELFERAAKADSTFSLAYYRLAWAHGWISGFGPDTSSLLAAARYSGRLPDRIRLTLDAGLAISRGDIARGESMLRAVLERYPDDFDANVQLGDLLFHQNPLRGKSIAEALAPLERASRLDQGRSAEPLFHLIAIAGGQGRRHDMDSLATQFVGLHQEGGLAISVRALLAFTRRDSSRIALAQRELMSLSTTMALRSLGVVAALVPDPSVVTPTLVALEASRSDPAERAQIVLASARLAGLRRDWRASDSLFARAMTFDPLSAAPARARFMSLPTLDPPASSLRDARAALAVSGIPTRPADSDLLDALLCLRLGDIDAALASIERNASTARTDDGVRSLWLELSARRLLRLGKPDQALAILTSARTPAPRSPLRFLRGEVLEALHRSSEALAWYEAAAEDYGGEFYVPAIARARERLSRMRAQ
jgi:tetratricopeptide (TPR) repeat protein